MYRKRLCAIILSLCIFATGFSSALLSAENSGLSDDMSFEGSLSSWSINNPFGTAVQSTEHFHSGARSLHITRSNPKQSCTVGANSFFQVAGGQKYNLYAFVKSRNSTGVRAAISAEVSGETVNRFTVSCADFILNGDTGLSGWTKISVMIDLTQYSGTMNIRPIFSLNAGEAELYIDDFRCKNEEITVYNEDFLSLCEDGNPDGWTSSGSAEFIAGAAKVTAVGGVLTGKWYTVRTGYSYRLTGVSSGTAGQLSVRFYDWRGNFISESKANLSGNFILNFTAPSCTYAEIVLTGSNITLTGLNIRIASKEQLSITPQITAPTAQGLPVTEVLTDEDGVPGLYINGEKTAPMIYLRGDWDFQYKPGYGKGMADAGIEITAIWSYLNGYMYNVWLDDNVYDFSSLDYQINKTFEGNPNTKLLLQIETTPPQWWLDKYPDSACITSSGERVKVSYASTEWRNAVNNVIWAMINHVLAQPYASSVIGTRLTAGLTHEWQYWGNTLSECVDFSPAAETGFRAWLREKYKTDSALKTAWGNSDVTLNTATVPTYEQRKPTTYQTLLDSTAQRNVIDFHLYLCDCGTDSLLSFAQTIKTATSDKWIVGAYNGYISTIYTYEGNGVAHMSIDRVLNSPYIDFICAPYAYGERQSGMAAGYMAMVNSILNAGKLFIMECDNRTVLYETWSDSQTASDHGQTYTMNDTVNQLKRDFANVITKGAGLWWYDMFGGDFNDKQIYDLISVAAEEMKNALWAKVTVKSEVAWLIDDDLYATFAYDFGGSYDVLFNGLYEQRQSLANAGTGYDVYYLSSLERGTLPDYKVYLITAIDLDDSERTAIKNKLQKDGKTVIFTYLPGIYNSSDRSFSAANITDITGIDVQITTEAPSFAVELISGGSLTQGTQGTVYGRAAANTVTPTARITDKTAVILGNWYGTNTAAVAVKVFDGWTSIYSAVGGVSVKLLQNIFRQAGCQLYNTSISDISFAGNGYIGIDSRFGGARSFTFSDSYDVYDVFAGEYITFNTSTFTVHFNPGETKLFRLDKNLAPNGNFDEYTQSLPEGFRTFIPEIYVGESIKVAANDNGFSGRCVTLQHTAGRGESYLITELIPITEGGNYNVSYYTRQDGAQPTFDTCSQLVYWEYAADGTALTGYNWVEGTVNYNTEAWLKMSGTISASEGAAYIELRLLSMGSGNITYFDEFKLCAVGSDENLAVNGNFERFTHVGLAGWNGSVVLFGGNGDNVLQLDSNSTVKTNPITVTPGSALQLTYHKTNGARLLLLSDNGNIVPVSIVSSSKGKITKQFTVPDGVSGIVLCAAASEASTLAKVSLTERKSNGAQGVIYGDVNSDGRVDIADLVRFKKHLHFAASATEQASDLDNSGETDIADLIILRKYLLFTESDRLRIVLNTTMN